MYRWWDEAMKRRSQMMFVKSNYQIQWWWLTSSEWEIYSSISPKEFEYARKKKQIALWLRFHWCIIKFCSVWFRSACSGRYFSLELRHVWCLCQSITYYSFIIALRSLLSLEKTRLFIILGQLAHNMRRSLRIAKK